MDVEVEEEGYAGVSCRRYSEFESIRRVVVRGVIVRADARRANNDISTAFCFCELSERVSEH